MADTVDPIGAELPAAELAEAIDACRRQDRRLDMYYTFATPTARKFIELGFYSNHFGEKTDPVLYARCRDAIAPTLSESDIRYLLRFESEASTKAFLNNLLKGKSEPPPAPAAVPETMPRTAAPKATPKRKKAPLRIIRRRSSSSRAGTGAFWMKVLSVIAVVCLVLVFGAIKAYRDDLREQEELQRQAQANRTSRPETSVPDPTPVRQRPATKVRAPQATPVLAVAENIPENLPEDTPETNLADETNQTEVAATVRTNGKSVVLTDGTRIRTRPDGTIEVPRVFSYAGAGLKKPFWIYDPQLEKSGRIEHEARAEKKARDRWKALYDKACLNLRQEQSEP